MKRISVVIPTFQRGEMVCDCVKSVLDTGYPDLEVLVVDDCSRDATPEMVKARFRDDGRVRYLRNDKNSQAARSRNHGAEYASGDYIFFLDDDNIVQADILTQLMAAFDRHPKAGYIAPLTCDMDRGRRRVRSIGSYFNPWTSQGADRRPLPAFAEDIPDDVLEYPTMYSPNAFMVTREAFDAAGGFDEVMGIMYEESDFGYRVVAAGYEAYIATKAYTEHYGYRDSGTVPVLRGMGIGRPARAYTFARNRTLFARRHFSFLQTLVVAAVFAPLSALYYGRLALRYARADIALAYFAGTLAGILGFYGRFRFDRRVGQRLGDG